MLETFLDSLLDALKLLPFLLAAYLAIEYLEHRASKKLTDFLAGCGKLSPLVGSAAGLVPMCGFSVSAAKLFSFRVITIGTLIAVFVSTSDEALPILFAYPEKYTYAVLLLVIKFVVAAIVGFVADRLLKTSFSESALEEAHDEMHANCHHDCCEHGIFLSALKHTAQSFVFILIFLYSFNLLIFLIGEDTISAFFSSGTLFEPAIASLVGFVPSCASSIILTQLFVSDSISFGSLVAGLITNAGIGLVILFEENKNLRQNAKIMLIMLFTALLTGYVIQFIELSLR
ncbi:MAG: putative manganese transporter [Oscillospiraceae bacterium]